MKKEILSILFVLILAAASQAAPSQFTTTGFMGIKTDDPQHALDIEGAAKSTAVEYPDGTFQIGAGSRDNLGWKLDSLVYDSVSYATRVDAGQNGGIFFDPTGTILYEIEDTNDLIHQHTCSTPWKVNTCSYDNINISTQSAISYGLYINPDGTRLYEGAWDGVYQYTCSTAWDLSSCSYDSVSIYVGLAAGIHFKPDGTQLYTVRISSPSTLRQWTCSTAWDLSSCSLTEEINAQDSSEPHLAYFRPDGKKMYEVGTIAGRIYEYDCSLAWNLSECSYTGSSMSSTEGAPGSIFISPDGTKFFEKEDARIYQWSFGLYTEGELGIGTEDPQAAVDVNGAIEQSEAYFHAYDAAGGTAIGTSFTDITWDTEVREDTLYTHAADSATITISQNGWYLIRYECTPDTKLGFTARYTADHRLMIDTGSGYTELAGTRAASYHRIDTDGRDTARITRLLEITASTDIKAQIIADASSALETEPDGCAITIERI